MPTVFLDTETTGLGPDDEIWEFAGIRREDDGSESRLHLFIAHDAYRCAELPGSFRADHDRRWPDDQAEVKSRSRAAALIYHFLADRPRIVGAVPSFDTERLARLIADHECAPPPWHHRIRCVETLTAGHLRREVGGLAECADALGLTYDTTAVHTAMGDAELAMRIYDKVMREGEVPF